MQNTTIIDLNNKIRNEIHTKLECINEQSRNYIKDVIILINKEIGIEKIVSIILFGSQLPINKTRNDCTIVSDCDLLIIFKDNVSNNFIRNIEKYFIALENKHNFRETNSNFVNKIVNVVNQTTGMFVSHFLTKRKHWENIIFHKIFRVNKIFSHLFAPKKIVLCSVVANSSILYGIDLREIVKKQVGISPFDMIKSTFMNLMISLCAIPILPLKSFNSPKYQLEAIKWALRASNYYAFEDSKSLDIIIKRFILFEKSALYKRRAKIFYQKFLDMRKNPYTDLGFMIRCPFRIVKIHLKGMLFKKIKNKNRTSLIG